MKTILFTLAALLAFDVRIPAASTSKTAITEGFKDYTYVRSRNIFDPSRRTDLPIDNGTKAPPPPTATPTYSSRAPFFALTGTLIRETITLGFFTGQGGDFNRVAAPGETIGGYKINAVNLSSAELAAEGKPALTLPIGCKVPLDGPGAGTVQAYEAPAPPPPPAFSPFPSSPSAPPSYPPPSSSSSSTSRYAPPPPPSSSSPPLTSSSSSSSDSKHHKSAEDIMRKMMERRLKETNK